MGWLEALILGIIQGLTEYLPVSSSGHIEIGKEMLGVESQNINNVTFSVVLHFGTVLSTVVVLWKDIVEIFKGLFKFKMNEEWHFAFKIVLSMIPAALVGFLFEDELDALFKGNLLLVGGMLIITGLLLFAADQAKQTNRKVGYFDAIIVGVAQMIAILPGISRSGATISTSVLLKIDKARAARFSFLMVIPLIMGKVAKDLLSGDISLDEASIMPLTIGFAASFIVGIAACQIMLNLVKRGKLVYFSIYCFVVGIAAMVYQLVA
ncbi:MAG: undecaprenyl-diphosphate phosphatase [Saprospiraceae bacterium]|nr:undecaprenyl-diphosphate phosphatase [Saprospiraceae bacterium]